jgi:hypothetical protein
MSRIATSLLLAAFGLAPSSISAQPPAAAPVRNEVLTNNAVVMTVTHGNIQNGNIHIKGARSPPLAGT